MEFSPDFYVVKIDWLYNTERFESFDDALIALNDLKGIMKSGTCLYISGRYEQEEEGICLPIYEYCIV